MYVCMYIYIIFLIVFRKIKNKYRDSIESLLKANTL